MKTYESEELTPARVNEHRPLPYEGTVLLAVCALLFGVACVGFEIWDATRSDPTKNPGITLGLYTLAVLFGAILVYHAFEEPIKQYWHRNVIGYSLGIIRLKNGRCQHVFISKGAHAVSLKKAPSVSVLMIVPLRAEEESRLDVDGTNELQVGWKPSAPVSYDGEVYIRLKDTKTPGTVVQLPWEAALLFAHQHPKGRLERVIQERIIERRAGLPLDAPPSSEPPEESRLRLIRS